MKIVRYAQVPDQPWRNGGGTTRELYRDERWRLSAATIAAPGAFSRFPGFDRVFVVAHGTVELTHEGTVHRLGAGELLRFAGEDAVSAVPEGEVKVVNVMVRRPLRAVVRVGPSERGTPALAVVDLVTLDAYLGGEGPGGTMVVVEEIS